MNIREIVPTGVCKHMDTSKTVHVETEEEKVIRVTGNIVRWAILAVSVSLVIFFLSKAIAAGFIGTCIYSALVGIFAGTAEKVGRSIFKKWKENKNVVFA